MHGEVICFSLSALSPFLVLWIKLNIIIQSNKVLAGQTSPLPETNGAVTFTERLVQCEEEGEGLTSPVLVHLREYHSVSVLSVRVRTGA